MYKYEIIYMKSTLVSSRFKLIYIALCLCKVWAFHIFYIRLQKQTCFLNRENSLVMVIFCFSFMKIKNKKIRI